MSAPSHFGSWLRELPGTVRGRREPKGRLDLIGLDMAPRRKRVRNTTLVPIIGAIVVCALALVWLRMDVVRMRYAAAEAVAEERELLDRKRKITVELLRLREPTRLAEQARKLGFATPDRVIHLPAAAGPVAVDGTRP
ncbi:MAG: hypothetical protein QF570_07340 [Myxococcota bacterium]|jgi:cell division protein FtsL|nr:hypothetical protein [Myxococcota bacterium]